MMPQKPSQPKHLIILAYAGGILAFGGFAGCYFSHKYGYKDANFIFGALTFIGFIVIVIHKIAKVLYFNKMDKLNKAARKK